jgi:hypothetical protein
MIKNLFLFSIINIIIAIAFDLNDQNSEMCFYLKGKDIGHVLNLDYHIIGKTEGLKLFIIDTKDSNTLYKKNKHKKAENNLELNINKKHNYTICWKNFSDTKIEIIFFYRDIKKKAIFDKGFFKRRCQKTN